MHLRISVLCLCLHWQCSCFSWTVFFKEFYALLRIRMRKKKTIQYTSSSNLTEVTPSSWIQYCQHHEVKYCIPTSSHFLYLRILCLVWHELTTCFYYGQFWKNELDLNFTYSMLGRPKKKKNKFHLHLLVQSHNTNCTYKPHTFLVNKQHDAQILFYVFSLHPTCTHLGHQHRMTVTRGCIDTICLSWW